MGADFDREKNLKLLSARRNAAEDAEKSF